MFSLALVVVNTSSNTVAAVRAAKRALTLSVIFGTFGNLGSGSGAKLFTLYATPLGRTASTYPRFSTVRTLLIGKNMKLHVSFVRCDLSLFTLRTYF